MDSEFQISIPTKMNAVLTKQQRWLTFVNSLISNVKSYYLQTPYFFPEFTSHGAVHMNVTLDMCEKLIFENGNKNINDANFPKNIAVLIAAVLTHDIGMFIKPDGLKKLLFGNYKDVLLKGSEKTTWSDAWDRYGVKLKGYSKSQIIEKFGDKYPVCFPDLENFDNLNEMSRIVIGDFLREYHPELAYEIIHTLFMGDEDVDIFRNISISHHLKEIVGLIALSHGHSLRERAGDFQKKYTYSIVENVSVIYLMTVLRMADYLDAGKHRAEYPIAALQSKFSPISKGEFSWNQAIDVDNYEWKKQGVNNSILIIDADPETSDQFLTIELWIKSLQKELDECLTIIGIYKSKYNIAINAIKSNIFDDMRRADYSEKFLLKSAKLNTDPEFFKLLIKPLYANNLAYGVRELLQNSVDACIERRCAETKSGNKNYTSKIIIKLNTKDRIFTIVDNGIGMNDETIINHYLTTGNTYQQSDQWKANIEENNSNNMYRIGNFGIGVLASFLIGDCVRVETKYMYDKKGYTFNVKLQSGNINIDRLPNFDIGTTISIDLDQQTVDNLYHSIQNSNSLGTNKMNDCEWFNWYHFNFPIIEYYVDNEKITFSTEMVPSELSAASKDAWNNILFDGNNCIIWKFKKKGIYTKDSSFYLNGMLIPQKCAIDPTLEAGFDLASLVAVFVSIRDYNNSIQTDLSRQIITSFQIYETVIREIFQYILAKLLSKKFEGTWNAALFGFNYVKAENDYEETGPIPYLFGPQGYTLRLPIFVKRMKDKAAVEINYQETNISRDCFFQKDIDMPYFYTFYENGACIEENDMFIRKFGRGIMVLEKNNEKYSEKYGFEVPSTENVHGISENIHEVRTSPSVDKKYHTVFLEKGRNNPHIILEKNASPTIYLHEFSFEKDIGSSILNELITSIFGDDIWIPFDFDERRRKFPDAFSKLDKYIKR